MLTNLTAKQKVLRYLDDKDSIYIIFSDTSNDDRGIADVIYDLGTIEEECIL